MSMYSFVLQRFLENHSENKCLEKIINVKLRLSNRNELLCHLCVETYSSLICWTRVFQKTRSTLVPVKDAGLMEKVEAEVDGGRPVLRFNGDGWTPSAGCWTGSC